MHGPAIRPPEVPTAEQLTGGASAIALDCAGLNFFRSIAACATCCRFISMPPIARGWSRTSIGWASLPAAGSTQLARIADQHPPVLHARDRFGRDEDWIEYHPAYREMEQIAFGDFQFHAMSHRGGVLGSSAPLPPVAKYAFQYLFVQAEFGLMCPISVTDTSIHLIRKFASAELQDYLLPQDAVARPGDAVEGHPVHDREGRRLRRRRDRDGGAAAGRRVAAALAKNGSARTPTPMSR